MPLQKKQESRKKKEREIRRLQRSTLAENRNISTAYRRARLYLVEKANGNADALEDAKDQLAIAVENNALPQAVVLGSTDNMINQINAELDRPESHSHAIGLLLNAADQTADFDMVLAAQITAIANGIAGGDAADIARWREIATQKIEVFE